MRSVIRSKGVSYWWTWQLVEKGLQKLMGRRLWWYKCVKVAIEKEFLLFIKFSILDIAFLAFWLVHSVSIISSYTDDLIWKLIASSVPKLKNLLHGKQNFLGHNVWHVKNLMKIWQNNIPFALVGYETDYSQLGTTRLIGSPYHIQCTLMD